MDYNQHTFIVPFIAIPSNDDKVYCFVENGEKISFRFPRNKMIDFIYRKKREITEKGWVVDDSSECIILDINTDDTGWPISAVVMSNKFQDDLCCYKLFMGFSFTWVTETGELDEIENLALADMTNEMEVIQIENGGKEPVSKADPINRRIYQLYLNKHTIKAIGKLFNLKTERIQDIISSFDESVKERDKFINKIYSFAKERYPARTATSIYNSLRRFCSNPSNGIFSKEDLKDKLDEDISIRGLGPKSHYIIKLYRNLYD